MNQFYECHLKKKATRGFLKWCERQCKKILPEEINSLDNEIGLIEDELDQMAAY